MSKIGFGYASAAQYVCQRRKSRGSWPMARCHGARSHCRIASRAMGVFKRPGRSIWWFEFEYRGRRYRESAGTRSKTLAVEIERRRRREIEEAANGIRRRRSAAILFRVAAPDWLTLKRPSWADKTHTIEKANIAHLAPHFGKLLLTDITDREFRAIRNSAARRRPPTRRSTTRSRRCVPSFAGIDCGRRFSRMCGCCPRVRMRAARSAQRKRRTCCGHARPAGRGPSCLPLRWHSAQAFATTSCAFFDGARLTSSTRR